MDSPRLIRGLRIAWSVVWGIVCVLLVVLWVRSYVTVDRATFQIPPCSLSAWSINGELTIVTSSNPGPRELWIASYPLHESPVGGGASEYEIALGFGGGIVQNVAFATIPCWLAVVSTVLSAAISWIRWSFSLRTLLIATTAVAITLGIVYATR
jgi:hypothetical protein